MESSMYYILNDHLGSVYAITHDNGDIVMLTEEGTVYQEGMFEAVGPEPPPEPVPVPTLYEQVFSFDAWGNRRDPNDWTMALPEDYPILFDRGFTGHQHWDEFGLINMIGRVYDPRSARFLSPDNYVQMPDFTQSFNRYSYCLNNPLKYTDPSGEFFFSSILPGIGTFIDAACWGALINGAGYTASVAFSNGGFSNWNGGDFWKSVGFGAASGALTTGVGQIFGPVGDMGLSGEIARAYTHGVSQAWLSGFTGYGDPMTSFASAGLGSLAGSAFMMYGGKFASSTVGNYAFSGLAGGVGAELTGGNFWEGAAIGVMTAGLNHLQKHLHDWAKLKDNKKIAIILNELKQKNDYIDIREIFKNFPELGTGLNLIGHVTINKETLPVHINMAINDNMKIGNNPRFSNPVKFNKVRVNGYYKNGYWETLKYFRYAPGVKYPIPMMNISAPSVNFDRLTNFLF